MSHLVSTRLYTLASICSNIPMVFWSPTKLSWRLLPFTLICLKEILLSVSLTSYQDGVDDGTDPLLASFTLYSHLNCIYSSCFALFRLLSLSVSLMIGGTVVCIDTSLVLPCPFIIHAPIVVWREWDRLSYHVIYNLLVYCVSRIQNSSPVNYLPI